jgi:hypothetical protein
MSILMFSLIFLTAILWIWALVDILRSRFESSVIQILWILVILIFPILGSIIYFQFGKRSTQNRRKFDLDLKRKS